MIEHDVETRLGNLERNVLQLQQNQLEYDGKMELLNKHLTQQDEVAEVRDESINRIEVALVGAPPTLSGEPAKIGLVGRIGSIEDTLANAAKTSLENANKAEAARHEATKAAAEATAAVKDRRFTGGWAIAAAIIGSLVLVLLDHLLFQK